ncbi:MAG TPA: transposase, partial [Chitinophaga sp.]
MNLKALKVTDFSGQNLYVGLDIHYKSWMVSIYSDEFELKTFSQCPGADQLVGYLRKHYPGAQFHLAYEAGFCGFWIQRAFTEQGMPCQVIHPCDIPGTDKEKKRKTDRVDSRKIAKALKYQELNTIFIPDPVQEADRQLLRSRGRIVQDITRMKNRIKAFLKLRGIQPPDHLTHWCAPFIAWLKTIPLAQTSDQIALLVYIAELTSLNQLQSQLERDIRELAASPRYKDQVTLLRTIPSIGMLAA